LSEQDAEADIDLALDLDLRRPEDAQELHRVAVPDSLDARVSG
jgi:hypothetical protein